MALTCPLCGDKITEQDKLYKCSCGLKIWKTISGKQITRDILGELLDKGYTPVYDDFISRRNGKTFSAALVLNGRKVDFKFPNRKPKTSNHTLSESLENSSIVRIRVESENSGSVNLVITGMLHKKAEINFGLVSSRVAELLGCITAVKLIRFYIKDTGKLKLKISVNDRSFAKYLLYESEPRKQTDKKALNYLFQKLTHFKEWEATFHRKKRSKLAGGPQAKVFPRGVFPYIDVKVIPGGDIILVKVPETPEVQAQFYASFWKAEPGDNGEYILPATAEKAVNAWIYTVKGNQTV